MSTQTAFIIAISALSFLFILSTGFYTIQKSLRFQSKNVVSLVSESFFSYKLLYSLFPESGFELFLRMFSSAQSILRFIFITLSLVLLKESEYARDFINDIPLDIGEWSLLSLKVFFILLCTILFGDLLPRVIGHRIAIKRIQVLGPIISMLLILLGPLLYIYLFLLVKLTPKQPGVKTSAEAREKILEIMQERFQKTQLESSERRLVDSLLTFRNKIAKEVMISRVDLFALPASMTLEEAAEKLQEENFSRIPLYEQNMDTTCAILLYKDLLNASLEAYRNPKKCKELLKKPIMEFAKKPIFAPETKKISELFQVFRDNQTHIAIIVDEYGRTEGLVTMEDILEELVGEISDEYDKEEESLFSKQTDDCYLVDARMTLLDLKNHLGLSLPQKGDYETLGGYISFLTGTIPTKGAIFEHDQFCLEIVNSTDRMVEKVKIYTNHKK